MSWDGGLNHPSDTVIQEMSYTLPWVGSEMASNLNASRKLWPVSWLDLWYVAPNVIVAVRTKGTKNRKSIRMVTKK
jgi:hypothetical protein